MKAELMLVGFISLLLAVTQDPISGICISQKAASIMRPCKVEPGSVKSKYKDYYCAKEVTNFLFSFLIGLA